MVMLSHVTTCSSSDSQYWLWVSLLSSEASIKIQQKYCAQMAVDSSHKGKKISKMTRYDLYIYTYTYDMNCSFKLATPTMMLMMITKNRPICICNIHIATYMYEYNKLVFHQCVGRPRRDTKKRDKKNCEAPNMMFHYDEYDFAWRRNKKWPSHHLNSLSMSLWFHISHDDEPFFTDSHIVLIS